MSDTETAADAVHDAFLRSLNVEACDAVNPDRRTIFPARFVWELGQAGWIIAGVESAKLHLDAILEDADDAAFTEGEEDETTDGEPVSHRNTWSGPSFVAACAAAGVTFAKAA